MIYLDNAATTRLDDEVLAAMLPYLKNEYGNSQSQHALGRAAAEALVCARDEMAARLGCDSGELYFVSGGTEAGNSALKGVCLARGKGHILVSAIEHPSVIQSAKDMGKLGFEVEFIMPDSRGVILPESVRRAIRDDTVFCAVMAANNETGVIQPVREIGEICKSRGVFYYADCVQAVCTQEIKADFCDGLGISAHKFYGPKGAGALYIKSGNGISPLISGGRQEKGLRGGTVNVAAVVGMAAAFKKICQNKAVYNQSVAQIRDYFVNRALTEIEGTHLNGGGEVLPTHANLSFDGCAGEILLVALDLNGVAVSTGSACSAGATEPSHVLTAMGLPVERVRSAVRFSFGRHNAIKEAEAAFEILKTAVNKIRGKCALPIGN